MPVPTTSAAFWTIFADADVYVHSGGVWADENLAGQPGIMAGADDVPGFWYAYLRFPIGSLPATATVSSARLQLIVEGYPELPGDDDNSVFAVHAVVGEWDETTITWAEQPLISAHPIARFDVRRDNTTIDEVEIGAWIADRVAAGEQAVSLVIVPAHPEHDLRRRWASRGNVQVDRNSDPTALRGPRLRISMGDTEAPAPNAAQLEELGW